MLRTLSAIVLMAMLAPSAAFAMDKEELALEKAEVKYAKTVAKDVGKTVKKWDKASEKGKDTGDLDKDLMHQYREELSYLRAKGVKTVEEPEPMQHPAHPEKVLPEPESETPKMEALRDLVVELKRGELKDAKKSKKLSEYVGILEARYERKNNQYKKHKKE